jgi:hypothetical protein
MSTQKIKDHYTYDVRLALLEQSITNFNDTLVRFEKRFDQIDTKFDRLQSEGRSHHKWTLGLISGLYFIFASSLTTILIKFVH